MKLADYYAELAGHPDAARRVGWRHRVEQAYRFEVALELARPNDTILDIGSGAGAFADYAEARRLDLRFAGLEVRGEVAAGRSDVVIGSFFEPPDVPPFDLAVAIGTLTATPADQPTVEALLALATRASNAFVVIHLDDRAARRGFIASDPALNFVSRSDWRRYGARLSEWTTSVVEITASDSAFVGWRESAPPIMSTTARRFRRTCEGPWGADETSSRKAWLAAELGLFDEAASLLDGEELDELGRVVFERLNA